MLQQGPFGWKAGESGGLCAGCRVCVPLCVCFGGGEGGGVDRVKLMAAGHSVQSAQLYCSSTTQLTACCHLQHVALLTSACFLGTLLCMHHPLFALRGGQQGMRLLW